MRICNQFFSHSTRHCCFNVLCSYVYVPEYIRWGERYWSWGQCRDIGSKLAIYHASFDQISKDYQRTIWANQRTHKHKAKFITNSEISWLNGHAFLSAYFFFTVFRVYNVHTFQISCGFQFIFLFVVVYCV